ncbi:MAG: mitochondrial fission ELM1 family protein [gamma proteobacterium symbiont of Bathyaustriella thionipta]|nr:mitochondrial fission ELM1 family protein [gamma proteobacterium symbiont of Bathyaustriella thionipta]
MNSPRKTDESGCVWLLLGQKAGDNNQLLALAERLQLPYQKKNMYYRKTELASTLLQRPTRLGIQSRSVTELRPPWPDVILTAGRRNESVAHWIKKKSAGHTRLVHLGRPWWHPDLYDLVITTPQYYLPKKNNVLVNSLPLHRINPQQLKQAKHDWLSRLEPYAPPYIVLLLGGNSGAFIYDFKTGQNIGEKANQMAREAGGTLLITSSRRTPPELLDGILDKVTQAHFLHLWNTDKKDNPYLAFLANADRIIVTGESISMLAEAVSTHKPVYIHHPQVQKQVQLFSRQFFRWNVLSHRLVQRFAPLRLRRNISPLLQQLVKQQHACWLEDFTLFTPRPLKHNDLDQSVAAVRQLLNKA